MNEELFPSGPWVGFYSYTAPADKHRMDLHLTFTNGQMTGEGNDDVGPFFIRGRYDAEALECHWTKTYPGSHDVFYRGFREGKGIWGTWEIRADFRGGFHIWPRNAGEGETNQEEYREEKPVDAVASNVPATAGEAPDSIRCASLLIPSGKASMPLEFHWLPSLRRSPQGRGRNIRHARKRWAILDYP
ncbi:MAG: hypothetical protein HY735_38240 [Verrucomicrobia bacterium]|nr:hypothetical protein [Verrucomicrobiota bacterium]